MNEHEYPRSIRPLITIAVPVYNEADNIPALLTALREVVSGLPDYRFEFLFTDNASTDETFQLLAEEARTDLSIRVLRLSRNFGFQRSILTNLLHARGDAVIQIDADLQDPPELIGAFLEYWQLGYKVVYGIRRKRSEGAANQFFRKFGYRVISALSEVPVPLDAGDFRLVDRTIVEHLRGMTDNAPYLRGMIASLGYPQFGIPYNRRPRRAGRSKIGLTTLIRLGIDGICSQSTRPLRYIGVCGVLVSAFSVLAAAFYVLVYFIAPEHTIPGFTTLAVLIMFSTGLNMMFLGLMGEYIGRIYSNVRGLPLAIIDDRIEPVVDQSMPMDTAVAEPMDAREVEASTATVAEKEKRSSPPAELHLYGKRYS